MPVFQSRDFGIDNAAGIPGLQSLFVFVTAKCYILIAILCRLSGYSDGPSDVGCQKRQPTLVIRVFRP